MGASEGTQTRAEEHFKNGVKLYQDQNYAGALAEFEAAYTLKPGASSLQNAALCLKALFRYAEAASVLRQALDKHASSLNDKEKKQLRAAIDELAALVGTLELAVTPRSARVSVDGRELAESERSNGVTLNVGEHQVVVEAPGYARLSRTVRLASQERRALNLALLPTHGFIVVDARDAGATIRVDGLPKGVGSFEGPVTPGLHTVRVEAPDGAAAESRIQVEVGKTYRLNAPSGGRGAVLVSAAGPETAEQKDRAEAHEPRGFYGYLGLGVSSMGVGPTELGSPEGPRGGSVGLRGGYRILAPLGVELILEGANQTAKAACENFGCGASDRAAYELTAGRIGANARFLSKGRALRFTSTLGFGAVTHTFEITTAAGNLSKGSTDPAAAAYVLAEVGAQLNAGHLLLELDAMLFLDGIGDLSWNSKLSPSTGRIFADKRVLPFLGIGIKVGLSQWRPPPK